MSSCVAAVVIGPQYPGRTLVFVNTIAALRKLGALLQTLRLPVHQLHANMQQRQRLKHLDRFRQNERAILVVRAPVWGVLWLQAE